jgi:hypothetical protein
MAGYLSTGRKLRRKTLTLQDEGFIPCGGGVEYLHPYL